MKPKKILTTCVIAILFFSCQFQKIGNDLGSGLNNNTEAIGKNLITGVQKGLSDSAFRQRMYQFADSLVGSAGLSANKGLKAIMDTLLSEKWIVFTRAVVEEATGKKLNDNIVLLRNNLLGAETNARIKTIVATAMNGVLNEETELRIARLREQLTGAPLTSNLMILRDSLVGQKTKAAIASIVDSAMTTFAYRLKNDVKDAVDDNASFIEKYAGRLLLLLGGIAAVIIFLVWRIKQKYLRMATVLTAQINTIPNQQAYNELTARIKEKAMDAGLEPTLRKMLDQNGLLGKENWEAGQPKKAAMHQSKN
ncbi:MAG: hypothetical protein V4676_04945 [Bacteroidota bacterium]